MKRSVHVRRPTARLFVSMLLMIAMLPLSGLLTILPAQAAYVNRYSTITNGALTFTGNTLGLSKSPNANAPGTSDAIGAFISTNTTLRDGTYPFGTTADWHQDSSAATLSMPVGSTVLRAELIWSGSYSYGGENVLAALGTPVTLTTPAGTFQVAPDPATSNILGSPDGAGNCPSDPVPSPPATIPCFFVRSADVTTQVAAAGAGSYVVGGVPATQGTADLYHNNAGWTLAVAYHNSNLPARSLSLFVGEEVTNSDTTAKQQNQVPISGFCTPPNGQLSGRLLVSATEGDSNRVGDQMQFGPTAATLQPVSGPNNLANNFFASQINNDAGVLDTTGTFGTRNQIPSNVATANVSTSGGRQGWDITNVDASARLVNGQTSAVVWGTSSGDQYVINALGTQIDIQAPAFRPDTKTVDKIVTVLGDTLTYSVVVENIGTANADNVVFFDPAPTGTSFIANTLSINGAQQVGADPTVGVPLGTVAPGPANAKTVRFQVRVDSVPPSFQYDNRAHWTYDYQLCAGATRQPGDVFSNQVTTRIAALQNSKSVSPIGPVAAGQVLTYEIRSTNSGSAPTAGTTLQDSAPAGTTYVAGSTTLNGTPVPDVGGAMPYTTARTINSPGQVAGVIAAGATAVIRFQVRVNAGVTSQITNIATIDEDGPGGSIPPRTVQTFNPVVDLVATKSAALAIDTAPPGGSPGDTIEYTVAITNRGVGSATNVVFNDNIPANSTYVAGSTTLNGAAVPDVGSAMPYVAGQAVNSPGAAAGQIAAGGVATIKFRVLVANPLPSGVKQIVNQGIINSNEVPAVLTDDPSTPQVGDPTITPVTAAPVINADKAAALLTDADNNGVVSPGDTLRYTITIANTGNTAATNVVYTDTPDSNTTLLPNTVTTTQGTVTSGNAGAPPISVNIGTLPAPTGKVTITYDVRIVNPLPVGVTEAVNQGSVTSTELPPVPTNDPKTIPPGDPTRVPIAAKPTISAIKAALLSVDADKNGRPSAGDTVQYIVTIVNGGNTAATDVVYKDTPDANSTLVPNSVQSSTGSVTSGNAGAPPIIVNIGTLPVGSRVTISYKVTINNPLPPNVVDIVNQGLVTTPDTPPTLTCDAATPPPACDPTIVHLPPEPRLSSTKVSQLFTDADGSGRVSPGDTLQYIVTMQNTGNAAATNEVYNDIPDVNTTLVIGSVQTTLGTVTSGNAAGDKSIGVAIGTIPAHSSLTISYRVTIAKPLDPTIKEVVNQGLFTGSVPPVLTDWPPTPQCCDPTRTQVTQDARLIADKAVSLVLDADKSGGISAGDTLQYIITIQSVGNKTATAVTYFDTPDANTALVFGSVTTSQGTITGGNAGVPPVTVDIGAMPVGAKVTIGYQVTINKPLPAAVKEIVNQGVARSPDTPDVPTNDPRTPTPGDPTRVTVLPTPVLTADKTDFLFIDNNKSGKPGAGDTLLYVVDIANRGNATATNVVFTDTPDILSTLVVGSVQTSQGTVTKGNAAGNTDIAVNIGSIPVGGVVRVSFQVRLKDQLTRNIISNQGSVTGTGIPPVLTNDPDTPQPNDPTITLIPPGELTGVVLSSFTATRQSGGVMVRWSTTAEFNTFGFHLYRSADTDRSHAVRVTTEMIPGQGRGSNGGSQYSWLDSTALSDTIYTYWLQEIEINGTSNEYGPTTVTSTPAANHVIYFPMVIH